MTEMISEFLAGVFNDNVILATIIIAIIPLIELKGAIPFGMSKEFWGKNALSSWQALGCSFLGGVIVTAILAVVFKPIYNYIKDKKFFKSIVNFFTSSAVKKTEEVEEKNKAEKSDRKKLLIKFLTVFIFVAIPIPGTGVYTGTVLAVLLGLNFPLIMVSVTLGNFVAGLIIMFICSIFPDFTTIIMLIFILLIVAFLAYRVIVHIINKKREQKEINTNSDKTKNN